MRYESFGANTDFFAPDCVENPPRNTMNGGEERISLIREKEREKMAVYVVGVFLQVKKNIFPKENFSNGDSRFFKSY
jgi:hypothetical protein